MPQVPQNAREDSIRGMCMPYGVIREVHLNARHRTGRVVFASHQQAQVAASECRVGALNVLWN